jgi:ligand-binding sensor domain-containing protein/DNA-binding CsgD family transcriptional regulator
MIRRNNLISLLFLFILYYPATMLAKVKNIGSPRVINYSQTLVQAGTQTWMIDQAPSGLIYFANNDGMLEFDGLKWRTYPLPYNTVVRSVKASSDGRIFAGGYNELGYFKAGYDGQLVFYSLHQLLPSQYQDFGEVWKIYEMNQAIIFQTFTQIMLLENDTIQVISAPDMFHFSYIVHNSLYIVDQTYGLFEFAGGSLRKLRGTNLLDGKLIWTMLPLGNNILIATADQGLFVYDGTTLLPWENQAARLLTQNQVFCAMALEENTYAFGTIQNGLIICDDEGKLIQQLSVDNGLQNNTVLSMHMDHYNNLWLGLDNGIDYVEINSPLTYFSTFNNLSSGYAGIVHQGKLYLGTNRGVFYHDWNSLIEGGTEQKFRLVSGTQGQVWTLEVIDGTLFCGHNSGIFVIEGTSAEMLSPVQGGWAFIKPKGRDDVVICGTYTYLIRFEKINGKWSNGTQIKGFKESSRYLANDGPQSIWISHGYKGVFRTHFNDTYDSVVKVDFYNSRNGFPSDKDISVYTVLNRPVFTTGQGIYQYKPDEDAFAVDEMLSRRFGRDDMTILKEDSQGNIWYFTLDDAGVFRLKEDGNYIEVEIPFRELSGKFIKWFQHVYPHDDKNVFLSTQTGFVHYTPAFTKNYQQAFKSYIRSMRILSGTDSVVYKGTPSGLEFYTELPHKYNHIQFEFAANDFENPERIRFFLKLQGFDQDWVEWNNQATRQFTNLRHGDYTFKVKAISAFGVESDTASIRFSIKPPWYLSNYAYVAYLLLFILLFVLLIWYMQHRIERSRKLFEEEQRQIFLEREKQLQIESLLAEQEVIKLRNEKLQSDKVQRDKELANTTMQIIQRSKSLVAIKSNLRSLARDLGQHPSVNQVNAIIKKINRSIDSEKQWEVFESHFENVHEEFLKRLKENYPDLTPRELKLCAYLRLNISSKEIANLMNISVRGVEISRYRLRKKLGLGHDTNLTDFIISF